MAIEGVGNTERLLLILWEMDRWRWGEWETQIRAPALLFVPPSHHHMKLYPRPVCASNPQHISKAAWPVRFGRFASALACDSGAVFFSYCLYWIFDILASAESALLFIFTNDRTLVRHRFLPF